MNVLWIFAVVFVVADAAPKQATTAALTDEDFANGNFLLENDFGGDRQYNHSMEEVLRFSGIGINNANRNRRWGYATIPYEISSLYNSNERAVVAGAIQEYNSRTCVKFVPRTTERDYIHITPDDGQGNRVSPYCYSSVGRMGGKQFVKMYGECVRLAAMIHELGHVVGFEHEHNRPDRDSYITILWDNIDPTYHYAYTKTTEYEYDTLGLPYDIYSTMHYPDTSFAKPGMKAFTLNNGQPLYWENQRLSTYDIYKIKKYYNC